MTSFITEHPPSPSSSQMPPSHPKIIIIGAGLSGLSLGRTLATHRIPHILYDKSPAPGTTPRHGYGVTISRTTTWQMLKSMLPQSQISNFNAVRGLLVSGNAPSGLRDSGKLDGNGRTVRVHRARVEEALSSGLDIQWGMKVAGVERLRAVNSDSRDGVSVSFEDGTESSADIIVAADGIHSVVRHALIPDMKAEVLPWVVFRGKRTIERQQWEHLQGYARKRPEEAFWVSAERQRLEVKVDDWTSEDKVEVTYTYSRPAKGTTQSNVMDPLHKPERNQDDAKVVPDELFLEIETINNVPDGFKDIFDSTKMRNDRLLHWLMRRQNLPNNERLRSLSTDGVLFIGEAARAQPILGSSGADAAIEDGQLLGEFIAGSDSKSSTLGLEEFYELEHWKADANNRSSEEILEDMHQPDTASEFDTKL